MKFLAKVLLLTLLVACPIFGQVSVTGNLRDITTGNVTTNVQVDFELQNYGSQIPHVVGTTTIVQVKKSFRPDTNGNISGTIYQNQIITPVGTFYRVCIVIQGTILRCNNYLINGPFDLNSAIPLNITPIIGPNQIVTSCFPFLQLTPSSAWTITHNENDVNVFVQTTTLLGKFVIPDDTDTSNPNVAVISWVTPSTGKALVCHGGSIQIATNQPNAIVSNPTGPQTIGGSQPFTVNGPTTLNSLVSATSSGTNPASVGFLSMTNSDFLAWRNSVNTGEIKIQTSAGGNGNYPADTLNPTGGLGANFFAANSATVAVGGLLRLQSGDTINWRNNTNSADVSLGKNSGDNLFWNGSKFCFIAGGFNLCLAGTPSGADNNVVIPNASGTMLTTGTFNPGIHVARTVGCATAAAQFSTCDTAVTWTNPFADANYTVTCTGGTVTGGVPIVQSQGTAAKTASAISVRTIALTGVIAQFALIECTAIHD